MFGSDYRTAAGHVEPQCSAWKLIEGGTAAVAIAPANYRSQPRAGDPSHRRSSSPPATTWRSRTRASSPTASSAVLSRDERQVDLLVVGSRAEAPEGRVMISSQAQGEIENATCPVLVLPARRADPLRRADLRGLIFADRPRGPQATPGADQAAAANVSVACERSSSPTCTSARACRTACSPGREPLERLLAALDGRRPAGAARRRRSSCSRGAPRTRWPSPSPCSRRSAARLGERARGDPRPRQSRPAAGRLVGPRPGIPAGARRGGPGSTPRRRSPGSRRGWRRRGAGALSRGCG